MTDLTSQFAQSYEPTKGLVFYQQADNEKNCYVESYDFDPRGRMINAHPLSTAECKKLSETLNSSGDLSSRFLVPDGLLPKNLIYLRGGPGGFAIWYTPARKLKLFFSADLKLRSGTYPVPPMLWKADRDHVHVYALANTKNLSLSSALYRAPFFNVHDDGRVCMGNVDINIDQNMGLEEFMESWQNYFFNSRFSHVIGGAAPSEGNIIQLWKSLEGQKKFPCDSLIEHSTTIKKLIA